MKPTRCTMLAFLLATLLATAPCSGQQPQRTAADLQKELDALKAQVAAMQKDLDEIKDLLAPLRAHQPPKPDNIKLDLGTRPIRGSASAKLILVEFTDYQ